MADVNGVGTNGTGGVVTIQDTLPEESQTQDKTGYGNVEELAHMPLPSENSQTLGDVAKDMACFGAGIVDGALTLPVNIINVVSGGQVARSCGRVYTAGNVAGTVGSMLIPGLGEANAVLKGGKVLGRVRAGVASGKALGKYVVRKHFTGRQLGKNIILNGTKYLGDSLLERAGKPSD